MATPTFIQMEPFSTLSKFTIWYPIMAIDSIEYCIANRYIAPRDIL